METKHTAGPWFTNSFQPNEDCTHWAVHAERHATACCCENPLIAEVFPVGDDGKEGDESHKNALLIAAAPDLLTACQAMARVDIGGEIPWVHNAALTQDIEALRAICLAYCSVWNNKIIPAIARATDTKGP
jgi:hypothetical protein